MSASLSIRVDEYRPRPADLVGFSSGWREPSGWLIKLATGSALSHIAGVAVVEGRHFEAEIRRRHWPAKPSVVGCAMNRLVTHVGWESRPLLFESTTLAPRPCTIQGQKVCGVQAHDPRERIREYAGRAWLYRPSPDYQIDANQSERLTEFLLRHLGDGYDYRQAAISGTRVIKKAWWCSPASLSSLFCSEYWAAALEQIRMLELKNPSTFNPGSLIHSVLALGSYRLVGEFVR